MKAKTTILGLLSALNQYSTSHKPPKVQWAFRKLLHMQELNLSKNRLTSLPVGPYLERLEGLGLQQNSYEKLPIALGYNRTLMKSSRWHLKAPQP